MEQRVASILAAAVSDFENANERLVHAAFLFALRSTWFDPIRRDRFLQMALAFAYVETDENTHQGEYAGC